MEPSTTERTKKRAKHADCRRALSSFRVHLVGQSFLTWLQKFYGRVGYFVGYHPAACIMLSLLVSTLTYGTTNLKFAQKLQDGFVSDDSAAKYEERVKVDFDGADTRIQPFIALIKRKDGGNLLGRHHFQRIFQVLDHMMEAVEVHQNGTSYRYIDLCGEYCESNQLLKALNYSISGVYENEDVLVDHPQSRIGASSFLVAHHIFGVKRKERVDQHADELVIPYNDANTWPVESNRTALRSISMIAIYFRAPNRNESASTLLAAWESAVFKWANDIDREFSEYSINVMGDKILGTEMVRGGLSLTPLLLAGIALVFIVVVISVLLTALSSLRLDFGLIFVILGVVMSPLMAVGTTFGLLAFCGVALYPVDMVIPFLITSIGVDDAFLMLQAWCRIVLEYETVPRDKRQAIAATVFAQILSDVGPSITITSVTNALAFAICLPVASPAMRVFSIGTIIAIILAFIFQITFFGSILVFSSRFYKPSKCDKHDSLITRVSKRYSQMLNRTVVRLTVVVSLLLYLAAGLFGAISMETLVDSQRIIPHDSPLLVTDMMFQDYFWREYEPIYVYVNNVPDIAEPGRAVELRSMVGDFESMSKSIGAQGTVLFLNHYEEVMRHVYGIYNILGGDFKLSFDELPDFLNNSLAGEFWRSNVRYHVDRSGKVVVDKFMFMIGLHNSTTWMDRANCMKEWRQVADKWEKFNVTVFSEQSAVYEGIFAMSHQTYVTAALTVLSMTIVCFFFVPSLIGMTLTAAAIVSITIGVIGFMSIFGFNLDPVTMSALMMSIGFSVDYCTHIVYHFQKTWSENKHLSNTECVQIAVEHVGWPMLQAAATTVSCFLPVAFAKDYTAQVFLYTIVFVVLFGVLHGLVVLPTLLGLMPQWTLGSRSESVVIHQVPSHHTPHPHKNTLPLVIETKTSLLPAPATSLLLPPLPSDNSSSNISEDTRITLLASESE